jgi:hypothetical protein
MTHNWGVPEKLVYYVRPQQQVTKNVRDQEELIFIKKAYAVDATSEKANQTAYQWAKFRERIWNGTKYVDPPVQEPEKFERDNTPFNYIEIYNIEYGAEGRVVFKIVTEDGYAFDVRLPEMYEMLLRCGADVGGRINGKFIWVRMGSQYRITCVDSPTHKKCLKDQEERKKTDGLKPLKAKELVPGGVYANKSDSVYIYAGKWDGQHHVFSPSVSGYTTPNDWSSGVFKHMRYGNSFEEIKNLYLQNPNIQFRTGSWSRKTIPTVYTKTGEISQQDLEWLKAKQKEGV